MSSFGGMDLLAIGPDDHVLGDPDAPVTLIEYGDFECPYCGQAYWEVRRLLEARGDRICFVFRHYPLTDLHPDAEAAAEASEAAAAQGRFWQMYALLYENQDVLDEPALARYASEVGLDVDEFEHDLRQRRFHSRVARDVRSGDDAGVEQTPTFFVNGELFEGQPTFDALLEAVDGAPSAEPVLPF